MDISNGSNCGVSEFRLICFPELQSNQHLLSIPLAILLLSSLVANSILMITVYIEPALQQPMYYFLSLLAAVDLLMCTVSTPRTLANLWFGSNVVTSVSCFSQMYFIHSCVGMESAIFLVLAFDRYVAICHPLRYPAIITDRLVVKAAFFILGRSLLFSLPLPFLAAYMNYCSATNILHCFCETLAVVKLSSNSLSSISQYSLISVCIAMGSDILFIIFSYSMIIWAVLGLGTSGAALKACRTCTSHLILILFFYSTIITIKVSNQLQLPIPHHGHVLLSILQHLVPPALNPIVYGISIKDIRQAVKKLFSKIKVFPNVAT